MTPVFRRLLFCLMMLALPVQGFAQAGMLTCHTGAGETQSMDHHAHADEGEHHSTDHNGNTATVDNSQTTNTQSGCCACGPSCGVIALHVQASTPLWVQHDVFTESTTNNPFPDTASRRIERPPKLILV